MSSFLNDPTVVSASALSRASPTDPTDGSTPSSMSRWVNATEVYWAPASLCAISPRRLAVPFLGAGEERVLDGVEDQVGGHRPGGPPPQDPATIGVDDQRHVDEPHPGRHVGKVGYPQPIWR